MEARLLLFHFSFHFDLAVLPSCIPCFRLDRRGSLQRQQSFTWESRLQDGNSNDPYRGGNRVVVLQTNASSAPQSRCTRRTATPSSPRRSDARRSVATSARPVWTSRWTGQPGSLGRALETGPPGAAPCPPRARAPCGKTSPASGRAACWRCSPRRSASTRR